MKLIAAIVTFYILHTNVQFLETNFFAYIFLAILVINVLYNYNARNKYFLRDTLLSTLGYLMVFSLFIAIYGLSKNFIQIDNIVIFNEYRKTEAFQTGLINFIISVITYLLLTVTTPNKRRIIK